MRALHRDIAWALARRGRVVEAVRHAAEEGDTAMLGRIAESTGGVRLWLEQGLAVLRTVDGALTPEVLSEYPRLALVRCLALTVSGDIAEAKRLYAAPCFTCACGCSCLAILPVEVELRDPLTTSVYQRNRG